jgi:long-chain acyl-CoA synthetase
VDQFIKEHNGKTVVREGYGLTETVAVVCLTPLGNGRRGSIGIPFPDILFGIFEYGTTNLVPYGEDGEICISGPTVMKGYYNNEEETKNALKLHDDGRIWLHTGDMGIMDEDGYVYFKQRYKRVIISSGYNIYPSQIEAEINKFPGVAESCAIGIPDPIRVQRIKVFVVLEEGVTGDEKMVKDLIAYSREKFAKFSVPKDFEFIDKLPRTKVGKIAYRELEELEAKRREQ